MLSSGRNPYAPRVYRNRFTNLWQFRCWVCHLTVGATFQKTVCEDLTTHLGTAGHAGRLALAKASNEVGQ
jgi:hypothetical protein